MIENKVIACVKEALEELGLSKEEFYRLRKIQEIPKVRGQRFLTTRKRLWEWFDGLCDAEEE